MTPQQKAIYARVSKVNPLTIAEIARRADLPIPTVRYEMTVLRRMGLVERNNGPLVAWRKL